MLTRLYEPATIATDAVICTAIPNLQSADKDMMAERIVLLYNVMFSPAVDGWHIAHEVDTRHLLVHVHVEQTDRTQGLVFCRAPPWQAILASNRALSDEPRASTKSRSWAIPLVALCCQRHTDACFWAFLRAPRPAKIKLGRSHTAGPLPGVPSSLFICTVIAWPFLLLPCRFSFSQDGKITG